MSRKAFTLVEVLLAMALLALLLGAFYTYLNGAGSAQRAARDAASRQLAARTLCDMLERDLMCSLAGDASAGAGISGTATEISVLTRSVSTSLATGGFDDRGAHADLEFATYTFDESNRAITISREPVQAFVLEFGSEEDAVGDEAARETIGPLERVRLRYYDGSDWLESFDSLASDRLPVAVEIAIWLRPFEAEDAESEFLASTDEPDDSAPDENVDVEPEVEVDRDFDGEEEEGPHPDVVRVVIIPDAKPGESDSSETGFERRDSSAEATP